MVDRNRRTIELECTKKGLTTTEKCEGCFNTKMSTLAGGFYHTRAQCVRDNARRVKEDSNGN